MGDTTCPKRIVIAIAHPKLLTGLLDDLGNRRIINMTNIGKKMMLDLKI
jgi:hypothetical protein